MGRRHGHLTTTTASRVPRRNRLALALALAMFAPACAFWDFSDWTGGSVAAAPDGGESGGSEGGSLVDGAATSAHCRGDAGQSALFCDDFENPPVVWTGAEVCATCTISVITAEAGAPPPSPTHVFFAESHSTAADGNQAGPAYRSETIDGTFDAIGEQFSVYVDRADSVSEAAVEELGLEENDGRRLRARVWLSNGHARLETVVNAADLSGAIYQDVIVAPLTLQKWHRMAVTLSRTPSPGYVSFALDGALLVDHHAVLDGNHLVAAFPHAVLRNGIRYLGVPPDATGWRILLDDVALVAP